MITSVLGLDYLSEYHYNLILKLDFLIKIHALMLFLKKLNNSKLLQNFSEVLT